MFPGAGSSGLAPGAAAASPSPPASEVPSLHDCVLVAAGRYRLGEPEREIELEDAVLIGRYPVANAHLRAFAEATGRATSPDVAARLHAPEIADHPATGITFADAAAFCAWAGARLPTGAEWEAAARGTDARPWPWGDVFDAERCACAEAAWGWTVPVTAHPDGASPCGAEQLAGNVWEWVDERTDDGWCVVRGGSYLDHAWGVRAARALPADPARATPTTGFRIAIDPRREP